MTSATRHKVQQSCLCRAKLQAQEKKRTKDHQKRKRQTLVCNVEDDVWYEPYMRSLRRQFTDESLLCDSKVELPWKQIALPVAGMRIRPDATLTSVADRAEEADLRDGTGEKIEEKVSTGAVPLPWKDLLITDTLKVARAPDDPETCGSSVEIPWGDLILESPMEIRPPREANDCAPDNVEIPWDEILVPRNIVIEPEKRKRHPSSGQPPRARADTTCPLCGANPCCTANAHVNKATVIVTACM